MVALHSTAATSNGIESPPTGRTYVSFSLLPMNLDDSTLIAYVDGELSLADVASIETALAESPDLQRSVDLLRASRLGYQSAFATQKLPSLPPHLLQGIEAMADDALSKQRARAASGETPSVSAQVTDLRAANDQAPSAQTPVTQIASKPAANNRVWLVAAFVAGAFCAGLALQFGASLIGSQGGGATSVASSDASPWVRAATDYQRLYTRDTVANVSADLTASAQTVDAIRHIDGVALRVPDLRATGMTFKSVARLQFNDKPLVQIVYLPEHGAPIALCVMKDSRPDQAIAQAQVNGMNVVSWRQNELSYALIGKPDSGDLATIAQQISTSRVDAMFAGVGFDTVQRKPLA